MNIIKFFFVACWVLVCGICCERERKPAIKGIGKYIACDVCTNLIYSIKIFSHALRKNAPYKKLDEESILTAIEMVCDPMTTPGEWIRRLDIEPETVNLKEQEVAVLTLKSHDSTGKCEQECRTISQACSTLLDDDEFVEYLTSRLYREIHISQSILENLATDACSRQSKSCDSNMAPIPLPAKFEYSNFEFVSMSQQDLEVENMMNKMDAAGYGDSVDVVDREDAYDEMYGDGFDDYGDDDFEEYMKLMEEQNHLGL